MKNIKIKAIDIYHPNMKVENESYYKHFQERGKDVKHFLDDIMGKKERFIIDNEHENGLTMGIEVAKKVLKKAGLIGQDIDMIVFSTQVPEYTFPSNAMFVHEAIEGGSQTIVLDSNANCAGMTVAVEQACNYMKSKSHVNRALVIGSDYLSLIKNPEEEITYGTYGDASCAVILEKTDEDTGFIDAIYHTVSANADKIIYPEKGLTNTLKGKTDGRYVHFEPFDASFGMPITFKMMEELLARNEVKVEDVRAFCLSQFAYGDTLSVQEHFHLDKDKMMYSGDRFGYTGTSSPFIAFHEGIKEGRIKRGDYVLFWTVGAGHQFIAMLFKY